MMADVWRTRIKELDKIQEELADDKDPIKMQKTRTLINNCNINNVVSSLRDADTDELLEDVNSIYEYIIQYNQKNMGKSASDDDDISTIQNLKDDIIEDMFLQSSN